MDELERRLENASEEVRQTTRSATPPMRGQASRPRLPGWVVFGSTFGAVLLIGLVTLQLGGDGSEPAGTSLPVATPTTAPSPTTLPTDVTTPISQCSSTGVDRPGDVDGLSRQAADIRAGVIDAAVACDFGTLVGLAVDGFTTDFGGGGSEAFEEWEVQGEGKLGILLKLFATDYAVQTFEGDAAEALGSTTLYVWPAAFARDSWDQITDEEMADLLTLYTPEELDEIAGFGSYAGWRTGITAEGDWVFFVAGD
jgi:hypothetical protein